MKYALTLGLLSLFLSPALALADGDIGQDYYSLYFDTAKFRPDGSQAWEKVESMTADSETNSDLGELRALAVDDGGYVYLTGRLTSIYENDTIILVYSPDGRLGEEYQLKYLDPYALATGADRHLFLTGTDNGLLATALVNAWEVDYPKSINIHARGIAVDDNGNVYVGALDASKTPPELLIICYSVDGKLRGVRSSNFQSGVSWVVGVAVDSLGDVVAVGTSVDHNIVAVSYDPDGNQRWSTRYAAPNSQVAAESFALDSQDNTIIGGSMTKGPATVANVLKLDPAGEVLWTRQVNSSSNGSVKVAVDGLDNIYAVTDSNAVKFDAEGGRSWVITPDFAPIFVAVDAGGDVFAAIVEYESVNVSKHGPDGSLLWSLVVNSAGSDVDLFEVKGLAVDPEGNVVVAAYEIDHQYEGGGGYGDDTYTGDDTYSDDDTGAGSDDDNGGSGCGCNL